jgi:hypothetical protein
LVVVHFCLFLSHKLRCGQFMHHKPFFHGNGGVGFVELIDQDEEIIEARRMLPKWAARDFLFLEILTRKPRRALWPSGDPAGAEGLKWVH